MNRESLRILEYNKILALLANETTSEEGHALALATQPSSDKKLVLNALDKTGAATEYILTQGNLDLSGNRTLKEETESLRLERSLSAGSLIKVAQHLECCLSAKQYGQKENILKNYFDTLYPAKDIAMDIRRCIEDADTISDNASPELASLRKAIKKMQGQIHSELNKLITSKYKDYLQEAVVTLRSDRYCIPIKAPYKGQVRGIVHDTSNSGSTYFIEPESVVELNNRLHELELDEIAEIERILASLSRKVGGILPDILNNIHTLTELDLIFAKGRLAIRMNGAYPNIRDDRYINLIKARHPLIDAKKIVPITVTLGGDYSMLIITGPNTGGKTVTLKTTGLLLAMAQSGLFIPASDLSEIPIVEDIYADIGDNQSIEQNLSTFSSHMTRIVEILEKANDRTLVLFDELCAGTDPVEGAALATAILERLRASGVPAIATTHYSELKIYAMSTEGVMNAGCEFDVDTMAPTYKLLIGIPGKSNALAISTKLGLPKDIIENAKTNIGSSKLDFEDLLSKLDKERIAQEEDRAYIDIQLKKLKEREELLSTKEERIIESREKILASANEEAKDILEDAKKTVDKAIIDLQRSDIKTLEQDRSTLREHIKSKSARASKADEDKGRDLPKVDPKKLKKGDTVLIISMNLKGAVTTLPDAKGNLFVTCGVMKMKANVDDLSPVKEENPYKNTGYKRNLKSAHSKSMNISPEIKLLGLTSDEAIAKLDKYLDDAFLSGLPSVRIVHGKGTGALRNAVHRHLKSVSSVKEFHIAEYGEGDAGVTIASFRE